MDVFVNYCENPATLRVLLIVKYCFQILLVVVPIIVIITSIITFFKPIISGKEDDLKAGAGTLAKKIIASLVVLMIPSIIPYLLSLTGEDTLKDVKKCISNVTLDEVKYYEKIESTAILIQNMKATPSKANIEKAKESLNSIMSFAKEDNIIDFLTEISQAEIKSEELEKSGECMKKGGRYENGYCHEKVKPATTPQGDAGDGGGQVGGGTGDSSTQGGVGSTEYQGGGTGGGTTTLNALNGTWTVVNTPISVKQFSDFVYSNKISQDKDTTKYNDKCLGFAYTHAWALSKGTTAITADDGMNYKGAGNFSTFIDDNKQAVLKATYEEITAGRPVVIQVNGNKQGTSRHFVAVVGYKQGVTSGDTISEDDLLIIDSWDAKLERMDTDTSRFMTSGAQCGKKDYSGYRIHYLNH